MRQRGFVLLPIIVIVLLVGALGYLIYQNTQLRNGAANLSPTITNTVTNLPIPSPTPDPTANWKTYINIKNNFSFKYPLEYTIKTSDEITGASPFIVFIYPDNKLDNLLIVLKFGESRINSLGDTGGVKTDKPIEMPNVSVGGNNYTVTKYLSEEGVPGYGSCYDSNISMSYVTDVNNKVIVEIHNNKEITCKSDGTQNVTKETTQEEIATAKQILSTFKFTN